MFFRCVVVTMDMILRTWWAQLGMPFDIACAIDNFHVLFILMADSSKFDTIA